MTIKELLKTKQEGIEYSTNDRGDIIMTLTEYGTSYMLKDGIDEYGKSGIFTYFIPTEK